MLLVAVTDAYTPQEIADKVRALGVTKAKGNSLTIFVLSVLGGAFIGLGDMFFIVVMTVASSGFGVSRLLGGLAFSLGLILVVVAGAELLTGNNLVSMAWASRLITLNCSATG